MKNWFFKDYNGDDVLCFYNIETDDFMCSIINDEGYVKTYDHIGKDYVLPYAIACNGSMF